MLKQPIKINVTGIPQSVQHRHTIALEGMGWGVFLVIAVIWALWMMKGGNRQ